MKEYLEKINQEHEINFSLLALFKYYLKKEQGIYQVLNKLNNERTIYTGYIWSHLPKY